MRGLALAAIALATILAGCAGEPPTRPSTTWTDEGDDPSHPPPAANVRAMMWTTLSAGAFTVGPVDGWGIDITIPPRTESILVNLTDLVGPTSGLRGLVAECSWELGGTLIARGQSTGFGCPQPLDGTDRVTLTQDAGRLDGAYEIAVYHAR